MSLVHYNIVRLMRQHDVMGCCLDFCRPEMLRLPEARATFRLCYSALYPVFSALFAFLHSDFRNGFAVLRRMISVAFAFFSVSFFIVSLLFCVFYSARGLRGSRGKQLLMSTRQSTLPDWWQREKQRRQIHLLILLGLLGSLIAFFYYLSHAGVTGITGSIDFDTSNTIAFIRQNDKGEATLYDIRADGTGLIPLTPGDDTSDKSAPAWSLDGKQVYYSSNRGDRKKMQIFIRGANDVSQLTYGTGRKENPFASPDGKRVGFLTLGAVKTVLTNGKGVEQILPPPAKRRLQATKTAPLPRRD